MSETVGSTTAGSTPTVRLRLDVVESEPVENDAELLRVWLSEDRELPRTELTARAGRMGVGEEIVVAVFDVSLRVALGALLRSLANHLVNRRKPITVRVRLEDGTEVSLTSKTHTRGELRDMVEKLAASLERRAESGERGERGERGETGEGDDAQGRT